MSYRNLQQCVADLESHGQLIRLAEPISPYLEAAALQRRLYRLGGPAVLLTNVVGCRFPMLCNLFGTIQRTRWLFRDSLESVRRLVRLQIDPSDALRRPRLYLSAPWYALASRPKRVRSGPVLAHQCALGDLPQLVSWPGDGGAYVTLPQVYSEDPDEPGFVRSNLGMYRVQISGGRYVPNREAGMHYQLHRGIAVHHAAALRRGEPLRVNVFVGGPPAMTLAAVMPLPEGISELALAGLLNRRRVPMICRPGTLPIHAEADFCIVGRLDAARTAPEGPFGDHLGYYSLAHDFPVLTVEAVYHRPGAIWPFTVVGRPPQEDTVFGQFIHELVGPIIPKAIPGVKAVRAIDAAGVHPLLLAIGSERYVPYDPIRRPRELLTLANALLGHGQLSLAKYLLIIAGEDVPELDVNHTKAFFIKLLERIDWRRDVHFQTCTTIDTLDYSGAALNEGSKVVLAAAGPAIRSLAAELSAASGLPELPGFGPARVAIPGVLVVAGPAYQPEEDGRDRAVERWAAAGEPSGPLHRFPLIVIADDAEFTARNLDNLLWVAFTRSDPARDIHGIGAFQVDKHWGCHGPLVIDARKKPHHAPELVEDPAVERRIDALFARSGPLGHLERATSPNH